MSRVLKIEILETVEQLKDLLNLTKNQQVKERIQTLYWLKSEQVQSENALANLTGKHRTTISRWLRSYRRGGINALLSKGQSTGRSRKLKLVRYQLKAKLKTPRPVHVKQEVGIVEDFKKRTARAEVSSA